MSDHPHSLSTRHLSWEEIHQDCQILARILGQLPAFRGILAVTRGGLVPAAILSRALDIRLVDTICISSYDDRRLGDPQILKGVPGDGDGWLVVDDLVDTGTTLRIVKELWPKAHFATLYAKPQGQPLVDSFVSVFAQSTWISFPWELPGGPS